MARSARFVFRPTAKSSKRNDLSSFPTSRAALPACMGPNYRCAHLNCVESLTAGFGSMTGLDSGRPGFGRIGRTAHEGLRPPGIGQCDLA